MKNKLITTGAIIGVTCLITAPLSAEPTTASTDGSASSAPVTRGLRILYTGHSFHAMFVPKCIESMAKSAGISDHQTAGVSFIGGSKVIQHWDISDQTHHAKEILTAGGVDVMTMSPMTKPDPGIDKFTELAIQHNPNIRIVVQEFWLPYDRLGNFTEEEQKYARTWADAPVTDSKDKKKFTGNFNIPTPEQLRQLHAPYFKTMDEYLEKINQTTGKQVLFVAPAGQAVIALRERVIEGKVPLISKQSDLFVDALGHGTEVIQVLVSYCNYAVIYRRSPIGLPVHEKLLKKYNNPELNRLLQEIAWDAVIHHPLSGVKESS